MTNDTAHATVTEPETIDLMGARMLVVARMGEGDDDTALIRSRMGPEPRLIPLHAHADVESFYILDGRLGIYLGDATPGWRTLEAGQSLTIPGNLPHAVRNASGAPVDCIMATTTRIVRFFNEIATPPGETPRIPPSPEDMAHVRARAEAYGYWMASPEENAAIA